LHVKLHEGAGQLLVFPGCGGLAGAQAYDRVVDPHGLARLQRQVPNDSVPLVEEAEDRHALGHRSDSRPLTGAGVRRGEPRAVRLLL